MSPARIVDVASLMQQNESTSEGYLQASIKYIKGNLHNCKYVQNSDLNFTIFTYIQCI